MDLTSCTLAAAVLRFREIRLRRVRDRDSLEIFSIKDIFHKLLFSPPGAVPVGEGLRALLREVPHPLGAVLGARVPGAGRGHVPRVGGRVPRPLPRPRPRQQQGRVSGVQPVELQGGVAGGLHRALQQGLPVPARHVVSGK